VVNNDKKLYTSSMTIQNKGFSLMEILIVIAIIGILASIALAVFGNTRYKVRDTKRKFEIGQIGRFLFIGDCYLPSGGYGEYDLAEVMTEIKVTYPQAQSLPNIKDPKSSTDLVTNYRYQVIAKDKCVIYANLENKDEVPTLSGLSGPEAGKGTGVLVGSSVGVNDTFVYYQYGK
jgi:prepilin-type N-terminal cleavage/methylation domain-containing protein